MSTIVLPFVDMDAMKRVMVAYDRDDDLVSVHVGKPRPADTEQVDGRWYLRLDGDEVVGLELHGLHRLADEAPSYWRELSPVFDEIKNYTNGKTFDADLVVEGSVEELPKTSHWFILMIGAAMGKLEAAQALATK